MTILLQEEAGGIATLTLNRPDAMNAISNALATELLDRLDAISQRRDIRSVILRGAGDRAFCAGADLKERRGVGPDEKWAQRTRLFNVNQAIWRLPQPVVAAIHGFCLGGGFELALFCDYRIATPDVQFSFPEMSLGAYPGAGGPIMLAKNIGKARAKEILLSARRVAADEALSLGVVDMVVPYEELSERAVALATTFQASSPLGTAAVKTLINQGADLPLHAASDLNDALRRPLEATRDYEEGIEAFFEKRTPNFVGR